MSSEEKKTKEKKPKEKKLNDDVMKSVAGGTEEFTYTESTASVTVYVVFSVSPVKVIVFL